MSRAAARESLFKLVYEYAVRGERDDFTLSLLSNGMSEDDSEYLVSSYDGVLAHKDEIMRVIAAHSRDFALDRIYKVDLAILAVAVYEILYRDDIPYSVSANEATELAGKYSTDKSYSFVNGLLASVIKEKKNG
ncbi:MAG TPA: transcription antitermination factor NusB [Candidatus Protoclostridium stercorigallinarum]|uniref:Transcription antitermination protein NusB n=1 Tax=Candidatus Protoclostridium stercorigallinarum TaxID=2838741 RepID=A0A9D1Q092_9FIRM|nr:transcription antitermination factor NusB [Candidatus Protoclostridium stercorigallinarum]